MPRWTAPTRTSPKTLPIICSLSTCTCRRTKSFTPPARSMFPRHRKTQMIPPIRNASRVRFLRQMPAAGARQAHFFFVFASLLFLVSTVSIASLMAPSQDSNAKTAAAAQQSPAAPAKPPTPGPTETTPLQKAVHQKKVITEEDLAKPPKAISLGDLEGEENNPLCDLSCEAELRTQLGFGPEREAEFRNQLTLARHEIADDKVWNFTLQDALKAAGGYCDLQRQKAQIEGKGVVSQAIRDNVNSSFAERERNLISQYRNSSGLLTQRIQAVQRFAPFRASVMQYQVSEFTTRICPDFTLP